MLFEKRTGEKLAFAINWSAVLLNENDGVGDYISVSAWVITPTGLTKETDSVDTYNTRTVVRVSGGAAGTVYNLLNRITLAVTGDILEEVFQIKVIA